MPNESKPFALPVQHVNIPAELKSIKQWVVWDYRLKDNEYRKKPIQAFATGGQRAASTTDAKTWGTFDIISSQYAAMPGRYSGIGFVFTDQDTYCGIDIDHCRDAQTGVIEPWAGEVINQFGSY